MMDGFLRGTRRALRGWCLRAAAAAPAACCAVVLKREVGGFWRFGSDVRMRWITRASSLKDMPKMAAASGDSSMVCSPILYVREPSVTFSTGTSFFSEDFTLVTDQPLSTLSCGSSFQSPLSFLTRTPRLVSVLDMMALARIVAFLTISSDTRTTLRFFCAWWAAPPSSGSSPSASAAASSSPSAMGPPPSSTVPPPSSITTVA
mmetsp:Transcript_33296/g.99065  ORF Transcript_33296/g.99065 Transcript_33296/m.99065 type:complete len:204 (+) Transcript_33296:308-919(+)